MTAQADVVREYATTIILSNELHKRYETADSRFNIVLGVIRKLGDRWPEDKWVTIMNKTLLNVKTPASLDRALNALLAECKIQGIF